MSATLTSLRIRNLALVDELLWEPPVGCVAITGETGAGKSILIGAVKLLLGERADKSLVRSGADTCTVEGAFDLAAASPAHGLLDEGGVEPCEDGRLIIRRTITTAGGGKQFVNGSPCTLALLRQIGDLLMDLHGPHDHQSLFSRDQQLILLDAFAGAEALRIAFQCTRKEWLQLAAEKKRLSDDAEVLARETDILAHQVGEIEMAALLPGEEEPLLARQQTATNGQRISEICSALAAHVSEAEDSLTARLGDISRLTKEIGRLDPAAAGFAESTAEMLEAAQDLVRGIDRYASSIESDPRQLASIESRLDTIQSLKRKFGSTVEAVIEFGADASSRLAALRAREERGAGLDDEIARALSSRDAAAAKLTRARKSSSPKLVALVRRHLGDLGFAKAGFSIALEDLAEPGPHGREQAEFLFSPNPGEPERPLRAIASSGEISRVMLAIKTSLATQDSVPILVFDEIDANVGGEIGAKVGAKMKELGASHQVFCITHLPQVASSASAQFVVAKMTGGERTRTTLVEVSGKSREEEIARMLGGKADSAIRHARALLAGG